MLDHVLIYVNRMRLVITGEAVFGSLVEFLRGRGLVGTKVGCGQGDCGACTVLVGTPSDGALKYRPIVSCLPSLCQLDGLHVVTIEGLTPDTGLSPIQQAMVDHHGSQCGFCTPGFVTALAGLFESGASIDLESVKAALAGNLCRCTGYLPILEAALSVDPATVVPLENLYPPRVMYDELAARSEQSLLLEAGEQVFFRPRTLKDAALFRRRRPGAVIVGGGTELGLERNLSGHSPQALLSLAGIRELSNITRDGDVLSIGANVTWAELAAYSDGTLPEIRALTRRFGSPQIQHLASVVGNIAHGSPVADSICFLLIVQAELELASARGTRRVAVKDFYTRPKQTVIGPDEIITRILLSLPARDEIVKLYKISKRKEMDVSTFRAAVRIGLEGDSIRSAAIAFAGVGPMARRLPATEAFMIGRPFTLATFREAGRHARAEVEPVSDRRGSREFRLQLAENILAKFYLEAVETPADRGSTDQVDDRAPLSRSSTADLPASWIGEPVPHESAHRHVTGQAVYIDDLPPFRDELSVEFIGSPLAHARIAGVDVSDAMKIEGLAGVFTAADVPGDNRFGPFVHDEELLAARECVHIGQPIVALAARCRQVLRRARAAVRLELEALPAVLTVDQAVEGRQFIGERRLFTRGDAASALALAEHVLEGTFRTGGQEHFYLETQAALAVPGEGGEITIHSSTQNPSEIQEVVAHCLGLRQNQVTCVCQRMGGGFGGKESQAAHPALLAALVAFKTRRPARVVYSRDLDMRVTGKRHPYLSRYKVGFAADGRIDALALDLYSDAGCATDLSPAVMDRSLFHVDNAYFIPNFTATGTVCRTNLPSNTAMRGFGAPQGIAAVENVIEEVAAHLGLDPFDVRRRNCYDGAGRDTTHYGQVIASNTLPRVLDRLAESADYHRRRAGIARFNATSSTALRGLALLPVKFGISFTRRALNQANAVVNIFKDGSIQVATGGTEMGQGLNTKLRQLVAGQFSLPLEAVRVLATSTDTSNNTSPTAASASTDLNGTAALRACQTLRERLIATAADHFAALEPGLKRRPDCIRFARSHVHDARRPTKRLRFDELVQLAYEDRVDLGARGFYATPGINFNRETGRGSPFLYFTNGAAVSEVTVDRLTGELTVTRVDILIDIGDSLNPAIDRGQVIGGFVQAMGWVTTEELLYSESGELLSHSPNNYKVPSIESLPRSFSVDFLEHAANRLNLMGSKAVGEPPFVLGLSVHAAARHAVGSGAPGRDLPLPLPATIQELLLHLSWQGHGSGLAQGNVTISPHSEEQQEANLRVRT
jgi:xanthine dehydrogenase molybdopterin binding subunit/xanthine dehydrogenase small subunit